MLAYKYAVRVEELRKLRWCDIDLKNRTVTITADVAKTGKTRMVPLPKAFNREAGAAEDLAFDIGDHRREWFAACVKIGAGKWETVASGRRKYVGPLLRHTRHSAVRNMVDAGLDRKRAKEISGHVTDSMFDRYNIGKQEDVEAARKAVEG